MNWISIKDRPPPINTEIIAYAKEFCGLGKSEYQIITCVYMDRFQMKGVKPNYEFFETCNCSGLEYDEMRIEDVSHWMPLPDSPKSIS